MGRPRAALVAFLAGFAVMALELCAVRLMAPHFGDSTYVWTNVIGVILVALAAGAYLGGRMADRGRGVARLSVLLVAAGLATAAVPLLAPPLGAWLLPQDLPLDQAMSALVRGSLVATIALFAPPVALLGCLTPMLVVALANARGKVGEASGLVASASTLGSLLGTFATTHVLVPGIGSRATIWTSAALVLVCAALLVPSALRAAAVVVPLGLLPWSWGPLRRVAPPAELLAEVESPYQYLQVVAEPVDGRRMVSLKINEGLDSFHSVALEGTAYTGGRYYDYHAVVPFLVGDGRRPRPLRMVSLGAAAGTFSRLMAAAHPGCVVDGVELDPAVVKLGERYFGDRPAAGTLYDGLDARVFVEHARGPYEVVLVDAYERQIYVPAHIASRQFFAAVHRVLRPGGVVSVNAGGRGFDDPVVVALARTMASVFGSAWAFAVPSSRNFVLAARRDAPLDPGVLAGVHAGDPELAAVVKAAATPGAWRRFGPAEPVLDDDRPRLDRLQERALEVDLDNDALIAMHGSRDPAEVERRVRDLVGARDYEGARRALGKSHGATPMLRALAGDVRWWQRDLRGADAEYAAALSAAPGDQLAAFLNERRRRLAPELAVERQARSVAARNGWLALLASALGLLLVPVLARRVSRPA